MGKPKSDAASLVINEEFIDIISRLLKFFKGDIKLTRTWIVTANYNFGNIPPLRLIVMGKGKKVLQFIENAEYENTPPDGMEIKNGQLIPIVEPREWTLTFDAKSIYGDYVVTAGPKTDGKTPEKIRVREVLVDTPETKNDAGTSEETSP